MLTSLALILFSGILIDFICKKANIPSLLGLILGGVLLGPSVFNFLDASLLEISADLRQIILIIILTRAGLALDLKDLRKVGRPAVLLSFIPATFEIIGAMILGPLLLGLSVLESALLGAILGAVSPAVVIPRMTTLIKERYGTKKGIPQLLLASSSVDDIFCLVLFASLLPLVQTGHFSPLALLEIPLAIFSGIAVGFLAGFLLSALFKKIAFATITQVLLMLGVSLSFISIENYFVNLPFSGILAVMALAIMLYRQIPETTGEIAHVYNQLWTVGELFLFILVGASINIAFAFSAGIMPIIVVLCALVFRMVGVGISLLKTPLNGKERLFCMIGYSPKATVQAAIGGVPLAMGLASGELILTVSVLAILITAPAGAFGMDASYQKLLTKEKRVGKSN